MRVLYPMIVLFDIDCHKNPDKKYNTHPRSHHILRQHMNNLHHSQKNKYPILERQKR
jgi:hypothetical protein